MSEIGEERAPAHLKEIISDSGEVLPIPEDNRESIIKLVKLCKEHNIVPIIVTTSYLQEYSEVFPEDVIIVFNETIYEICDKYEVQYWDYTKDERFYNTPDFFRDTDHLNGNGSKEFTGLVMKRIQTEILNGKG